ncbi:hypothetical protein ABPG72_004063 [Tetrahymena utriculariae]
MIDNSLNKINLMQLYADSIDQQIFKKYSYESEKSFLQNSVNDKPLEDEQKGKLLKKDQNGYKINSQSKILLANQETINYYKIFKRQLSNLNGNSQKKLGSYNQQRNSSPNIASFLKDENIVNHLDQNEIQDSENFKIVNKQKFADKSQLQKVEEGEKQQILLKSNHFLKNHHLGSKYSDIIRRKQTLQILSNHNENNLILQYDKYFNTHIYDNKFILQRQKQIKYDQDLYMSQKNQDQIILKSKKSQSVKKSQQLSKAYKEDGDLDQRDLRFEKQSGFLSERLHYNEIELMSIKKNNHIKERNKMRQLKFNSNMNQSLLNGLAIYQNNLKGGGGGQSNQSQKIGTFRSNFLEKSLIDSKRTSRNTINEDYKLISQEQILPSVKTQKMGNINDDFHKMTFTQKKTYYKEILLNQKNQSSIKLGSDLINDHKSQISQNQTIFKENFEKQKIIQESMQANQQINKNSNNSHNVNIQPFLEPLLNKQQPKDQKSTIDEKYMANNNKQKQEKEDLERKQYLRKNFLESRKKVILQKDIQEQVAKLTQLKNPQEYSQIYKLLNIYDDRDNTNISSHIKEQSNSTKNKAHIQELSTPKKIGLLILNQAQQSSNSSLFENKINNQPKQQKQIPQLENSNQTNQVSPTNNIDKLIIYSNSEKNVKPQKFITKDQYLNEWVNGLQGLEIEPKQNNLNNNSSNNNNILEGEDEDEGELNFFLKSQNFQQNQRHVGLHEKQTKVRNSVSREIQKSQVNQTEKKSQQQDAQNSNNKTILKILSYQTNKQQSASSDSKIKQEFQIQSKKTDLQTQISSQNEKAISASQFDNNDIDNQNSSQQQNYGSSKIILEMIKEPQECLQQKSQKNIEIKQDLQNGNLISFNQQNIIEELKSNTKNTDPIKKLAYYKRNSNESSKQQSKQLPQILDGIQMQINYRVQTKKQ